MAIPSDALYSGTQGTCNWYVTSGRKLVIEPSSGSSGYITQATSGYPWASTPFSNPTEISSSFTSAEVKAGVAYRANSFMEFGSSNLFCNCPNLQTVTAPAAFWNSLNSCNSMFHKCSSLVSIAFNGATFANSTNMQSMFFGCSSLVSLDLSSFNTANVEHMSTMFAACDLLTSVTFGNNWVVPVVEGESLYLAPCTNTTSGIHCETDSDYVNLTDEEKRGTWRRFVSQTFEARAYRTQNGTADEDGSDVTIEVAYAISGEETTSTLTIYKKESSQATYPSTPVVTRNLTGSSGNVSVEIEDIGDLAYDFRVEWSYGTVTCIAFPSVASNIHLVDIDTDGNVHALGSIYSEEVYECYNKRMIQRGEYHGTNIAAGNYKDFTVDFDHTFKTSPIVVTTFVASATPSGVVSMGNVSMTVFDVTPAHFKVRVYNNASSARVPYINWIAAE